MKKKALLKDQIITWFNKFDNYYRLKFNLFLNNITMSLFYMFT